MFEKLLKSIQQLSLMVEKENLTRSQVKMSDDYEKISNQIAELEIKRSAMFEHIEDSDEELRKETERMKEFLSEDIYFEDERIERKWATKKAVNPNKVLHALGGDIGMFFELVNIPQNALKSYLPENKELQKEFKSCIDITSKTISGFKIKTT